MNRNVDYFADALEGRTWTLESLIADRRPPSKRANTRLSFAADERLRVALATLRVQPRHFRIAEGLVASLAAIARERLGWDLADARRQQLVEKCARRLASYPTRVRAAEGVFRRVQPQVALVEEGCYGHRAAFNWVAQGAGVIVAEFQHGMVTPAHDAYNVGPALATNPDYRRTQPEVFLAYGSWWNEQFNAPVSRKLVVGNPHRSEVLRDWRPKPDRRTIIVLGDGVDTDTTIAFARDLGGELADRFEVTFRPHPLERQALERSAPRGTRVDLEGDLYRSLSTAHAIVGEASTALFESIGLVDRVIAWDTPKSRAYLGAHEFERAASPRDVARLLALPGGTINREASGFWAENWRTRLERFIANPSIGRLD